jgi:hypothetical protein
MASTPSKLEVDLNNKLRVTGGNRVYILFFSYFSFFFIFIFLFSFSFYLNVIMQVVFEFVMNKLGTQGGKCDREKETEKNQVGGSRY